MARKRPAAFRRNAAPATEPRVRTQPSATNPWPARAWIAVAALATFGRALPFPLQRSWDDGRFILDNPAAREPSLAALRDIFGRPHFEAYHPLHLLGYWLDVPWFGPNPWAVHATSLVLWVLALWLLHAVFRELGLKPLPALLGTLACGLHPVQVEAVVWATGRKDVLAMAFGCAALLLHLRSGSGWDARAHLSRLAYACALLSKTTVLPLPLVVFGIDLGIRGVPLRKALLRQVPSFALAAAAGFGVLEIWRDHTMVRTTIGGAELAPLRFVQTLGHHLWTAVWPAWTAPMYATGSVIELDPLRTAAVAAWLVAVVVAYRRRSFLVVAGLLGWAALMLPVSNLVPMYFPLQDRYGSFPLVGLSLAFAALLPSWDDRSRRAIAVIGVAVVAALSLRSVQYTGVWASETQLWGHAVSTQPDADYAWLKLGEVRRESGDLDGAIAAYQAAVHVAPLRKLAHAALFEAVALRDERIAGIQPTLARALAQRYYEGLESSSSLQELAAFLMQRGYVRTVELPLQIVIARERLPDDALAKIARAQLAQGRRSLARFYAASMREAPDDPELKALLAEPSLRVVP